MAWGIACKNCGWQESDHNNWLFLSEDEKKLGKTVVLGFQLSLWDCRVFEYSDEGLIEAYYVAVSETHGVDDQKGNKLLDDIREIILASGLPLPEGMS